MIRWYSDHLPWGSRPADPHKLTPRQAEVLACIRDNPGPYLFHEKLKHCDSSGGAFRNMLSRLGCAGLIEKCVIGRGPGLTAHGILITPAGLMALERHERKFPSRVKMAMAFKGEPGGAS